MDNKLLWRGLKIEALENLEIRNYDKKSIFEKANDCSALDNLDTKSRREVFIPGVEVFKRKIFQQARRGFFGELLRLESEKMNRLNFYPKQWSAARMYAGSAKGFHIHPPFIPENMEASDWIRNLFVENIDDFSQRQYDKEQWDLMFFLQGRVEILLIDERVGLERKKMCFLIDGDDQANDNNYTLLIPPGVAHAFRCDSSRDAIMVYATSTNFAPEREGRIFSEIEKAKLPTDWQQYWV